MTHVQINPKAWTEMKPIGKGSVPEGLWLRCPGCAAMIYRRQVEHPLRRRAEPFGKKGSPAVPCLGSRLPLLARRLLETNRVKGSRRHLSNPSMGKRWRRRAAAPLSIRLPAPLRPVRNLDLTKPVR